jgi:hypothetical protein
MGGVIQRLCDCMGFILLNMRERVLKGVNPECFMGGVIQRLYGFYFVEYERKGF